MIADALFEALAGAASSSWRCSCWRSASLCRCCNLLPADLAASTCRPIVVALFGKYLCYAMLALAIDLVWGYCGILSLGHGAFFALGGYAMGMYLMRQIGTARRLWQSELPDFMVFLNWRNCPGIWYGFDNFWFAALMVVLVPGAAGLRLRLARLPLARHRRLSVDHHPGADLRAACWRSSATTWASAATTA